MGPSVRQEDVDNYDGQGHLVDHEASFEHGVDGAFGGIVMLADPQVGDAYRQEYSAGEGAHLLEDLLSLARSDARAGRVPVAVDLDDVVGAAARRFDPTTTSIDLLGGSGGQVRGDPISLDRLVTNLLDNAVRHPRTRVAVTLNGTDDGTVTLTVDDDGAGVSPADRHRVFERSVRLDEARSRDEGGSGLGLAIVAGVAVAHGARMVIEESPSGGDRFRVVFAGA